MGFEKLILLLFRRRLRHNFFSDEDIERACRVAFSPRELLFRHLWHAKNDPLAEYKMYQYNSVVSMPDSVAGHYMREIEYLRNAGVDKFGVFPYEQVKTATARHNAERDKSCNLYYVLHKGKRLYFPSYMSKAEVERLYSYFIETEGILGGGFLQKSPHCYVDDVVKVERGDVLLDVGCSEGLFALDNLDCARKVYLFEAQKCWVAPNVATFGAYGEKVCVINKFVGTATRGRVITLEDAVREESDDATYFIKMDIEGAERMVLRGARSFLMNHKVKVAVAAYHRQDDAAFLEELLKGMGFATSFSDGYMLPNVNGFVFPYFRKGIIRARNY